MKRGREPIADKPQKDLHPKQRNSRLYSFRVNRASGDANDIIVRNICDQWMDDGIFTEMIKKGVLLAQNAEPLTVEEATRDLLHVGREYEMIFENRLRQLDAVIHKLSQVGSVDRQAVAEHVGEDLPEDFLNTILANFDE